MRLLVIGGSGAVGSAVLRHACARGFECHAVLRPESDTARLEAVRDRVSVHRLRSDDAQSLARLFLQLRPEGIVLAAFPRGYARDPALRRAQADAALGNLLAVFEAAAQAPLRPRLVLLGSATVYGAGAAACSAGVELRPQSFRGALKAAESVFAQRLAIEHRIPLVELRLFTGYGPFEQRERFIPHLLRAALGAEAVQLARDPRWRDWVHYDDVARACLLALEHEAAAPNSFDLCHGRRYSLHETAERLERIVGRRLVAGLRDDIRDEYGDIGPGSPPDPAVFDWRPQMALDDGLAACWQWARTDAGRAWLGMQECVA